MLNSQLCSEGLDAVFSSLRAVPNFLTFEASVLVFYCDFKLVSSQPYPPKNGEFSHCVTYLTLSAGSFGRWSEGKSSVKTQKLKEESLSSSSASKWTLLRSGQNGETAGVKRPEAPVHPRHPSVVNLSVISAHELCQLCSRLFYQPACTLMLLFNLRRWIFTFCGGG